MKQYQILFLFLLVPRLLEAQTGVRLSPEYLRGKALSTQVGQPYGCAIKFADELSGDSIGLFELQCDSAEAKVFKISGKWIVLSIKEHILVALSYGKANGADCLVVQSESDDLDFTQYLQCRGGGLTEAVGTVRFGIPESAPIGKERTFKGTRLVVFGKKDAKTTGITMLRETPDVSGKAVCTTGFYCPDAPKAIPDGTILTVIARTVSKESVGGAKNYWYLVRMWPIFPPGIAPAVPSEIQGYVFGDFVKVKE